MGAVQKDSNGDRYTPLGVALERLRATRKWKQTHMARYLGVTPSAVSRWESGETMPAGPTVGTLISCMEESGVEVPEFLHHLQDGRSVQSEEGRQLAHAKQFTEALFALADNGRGKLWARYLRMLEEFKSTVNK